MSDQPSITCPVCHRTSYNRHDVEHRYCGFCHKFHDDMPAEATGRPGEYKTPGACCPTCAHPFDIAVTRSGKPPERGTISVCLKCGAAAIFIDGTHVQPLTPEDLEQLAELRPKLHTTLLEMQRLVRR